MRFLIPIFVFIAAGLPVVCPYAFLQKGHTFNRGYVVSKNVVNVMPDGWCKIGMGRQYIVSPKMYFLVASPEPETERIRPVELFQVHKSTWDETLRTGQKINLFDIGALE